MKKLLFSTLAFIAMCFGIVACHDMDDYQPQDDSSQAKARMKTITVEEAKKQALMFVDNLGIQTRSLLNKEVGEVFAWRYGDIFAFTRAGDSGVNYTDTMLYIVNFANEDGYILVSAKERSLGVVAYVEQGNLTPDTEIDIPGFQLFLDGLRDIQLDTAATPVTDLVTQYPDAHWRIYEIVNPMIYAQWGEDAPFNTYCRDSWGFSAPAGNAPTVTAQLVSKHRYPTSHAGHTYNWNLILSDTVPTSSTGKDMAARLINDIGVLENAHYSRNKTEVDSPEDIKNCFDSLGYSYSYGNYDYDLCASSVRDGYPVLAIGLDYTNEAVKFWNVDGLLTWIFCIERPLGEQGPPIFEILETKKYLHCDWGARGRGNGYFLNYGFCPNERFSRHYSDPVTPYQEDDKYNQYNDMLLMFYDVEPDND